MTCTELTLNPGNQAVLRWSGVKDYTTTPPAVVTTAEVEVTLLNAAGGEVVGQTWPASMPHVSGETYQVTLESDLAIVARRPYFAHIVATVSSVVVADLMIPISVAPRTS